MVEFHNRVAMAVFLGEDSSLGLWCIAVMLMAHQLFHCLNNKHCKGTNISSEMIQWVLNA